MNRITEFIENNALLCAVVACLAAICMIWFAVKERNADDEADDDDQVVRFKKKKKAAPPAPPAAAAPTTKSPVAP